MRIDLATAVRKSDSKTAEKSAKNEKYRLKVHTKVVSKVDRKQRPLAAVSARYCNSSSHFKLQVVVN